MFFCCILGPWAMAFHCRAVKNSLRGTTLHIGLRLEKRSCIYYVLLSAKICIIDTSVVDRHRFDAHPDPDFHVGAYLDPIRIRIGIMNDADPHADPTPRITHNGTSEYFLVSSHNIASLQCCIFVCHDFQYFLYNIEILWKKG